MHVFFKINKDHFADPCNECKSMYNSGSFICLNARLIGLVTIKMEITKNDAIMDDFRNKKVQACAILKKGKQIK